MPLKRTMLRTCRRPPCSCCHSSSYQWQDLKPHQLKNPRAPPNSKGLKQGLVQHCFSRLQRVTASTSISMHLAVKPSWLSQELYRFTVAYIHRPSLRWISQHGGLPRSRIAYPTLTSLRCMAEWPCAKHCLCMMKVRVLSSNHLLATLTSSPCWRYPSANVACCMLKSICSCLHLYQM